MDIIRDSRDKHDGPLNFNEKSLVTIDEIVKTERRKCYSKNPNCGIPKKFKEMKRSKIDENFLSEFDSKNPKISKDGDVWTVHEEKLNRKVLIVPKRLQKRVLYHFHGNEVMGHLVTPKTIDLIRKRFWWKKMGSILFMVCKTKVD